MRAIHLVGRARIACSTPAIDPNTTTLLNVTSCARCLRALREADEAESLAAFDRHYWARAAADCQTLGMGHLWDEFCHPENANGRIVRGTLAALARCLVELREEADQ